ncbi:serine protease inhibitor A3C-like [Acomys russatus]|uniref:serine protease inhibitor A3C-like n=1 Tax=Acomys russatus TaxID=60746 RepID=UPI0021E2AF9E|nr:serine protease inhibitor A3C-like [Acomys russatus]
MALLVSVGILMAGILPALLCYPDATLRRGTLFHDEQLNGTLVDSLTSYPNETDFIFKIYRELVGKNQSANILFSPYGLLDALGVLSLGAKGNTLTEILESLKHSHTDTPETDIHQGFGNLQHKLSQPGDQVQISTGSAMVIEKHLQILAEFKEKARALYQAETFLADFQKPQETKKLINDYVRKQTQGKIKEMISDLDDRISMVLVNYIYFKGEKGHWLGSAENGCWLGTCVDRLTSRKQVITVLETWMPNLLLLTSFISPLGCFWKIVVVLGTYSKENQCSWSKRADMGCKWKWPFDPLDTIISEFQLDKRRSVKMLMMTLKSLSTPYFRDEKLSCSVVELKYTGNAKAMFILPDQGKMQQVEASLQPETLKKWRRSLKTRRFDELHLPKFSISKDYRLENILPELGIREVFSPQADLSRITGAKNLSLSEVHHNTVLEVDETSANGRASTEHEDTFLSPKLKATSMTIDRPFMFLITSTDFQDTYFMGKLTDPNQG